LQVDDKPDDFPNVTEFKEKEYVEVLAEDFVKGLKRTVWATDKKAVYEYSKGVCLELIKHKLTMSSTDGRHLAVQTLPIKKTGDPVFCWKSGTWDILPFLSLPVCDFLLKILKNAGNGTMIKIGVHGGDKKNPKKLTQIYFESEGITFFAALDDVRFPSWRNTVDPYTKDALYSSVIVPELVEGLQKIRPVVVNEPRSLEAAVTFAFDKKRLMLKSAVGAYALKAEGSLDNIFIRLDPVPLITMLKALGDKPLGLRFFLKEGVDMVKMAAIDGDFFCIVMGIRGEGEEKAINAIKVKRQKKGEK
jgi:hypothetical protein